MKNLMTNGAALLMATVCLFPAAGNASTIFNFSASSGSTGNVVTGTTGGSISGVNFNTLTTNTSLGTLSGLTVQLNYSGSTDTLTITGTGSGGSDGFDGLTGTLLTIKYTTPLTIADSSTINLYSATAGDTVTYSSAFLNALGLESVTSISSAESILTSAAGAVTSTSGNFVVAGIATPEPSTWAMFGLALLAMGSARSRMKLAVNRARR